MTSKISSFQLSISFEKRQVADAARVFLGMASRVPAAALDAVRPAAGADNPRFTVIALHAWTTEKWPEVSKSFRWDIWH